MSNTEIVNGLHALADFIEDYPIVTAARTYPTEPLSIIVTVDSRQIVNHIAEIAGTDVETAHEYTITKITRGHVQLKIVHIAETAA